MKSKASGSAAALVVELLCCLLGGCVVCAAFLPSLGHEADIADCALYVAVDLSVIFLLSRRWWLAPALILALGALGSAAAWYFHAWDAVTDYVRGFLAWYKAAFPYTLPYSENGSLLLVRLGLCFPASLLLYLYFRRFPFLPVWIALSGGLLGWLYFTGSERFLATAAILLIVLFVLIARTNAGSIKAKLGGVIPAASMQVTALILAPLVVLFAVAAGPKEDGAWQSEGLVHFIEDIADAISLFGGGGSGSGGFGLAYSGLSPNGARLGGNVEPDNKPVMSVKTDNPILMAGSVCDVYDGSGWYDSGALGHYRFDSFLWRGKRREIFALDKPHSREASIIYNQISRVAELEVSMSLRFRSLFAGGKVEELTLHNGDASELYFNNQGELFFSETPPNRGASYLLRARVFDRELPDFDENMKRLLACAAADDDDEYEDIAEKCTQVPDCVEPAVRELAQEICSGCEDAYSKALAIEGWLKRNCAYTRSPGDPPEGRDFVSAFLETREGYCTYYASAMTVLARLAGLPARYVTGYGVKQADTVLATTSYMATNATAHAWTQIYFYGVGWMDFDPTGWNFFELVEKDAPQPRESKTDNGPPPVTELPELTLPEPELPKPELNARSQARSKTGTGKVLLVFLCCDAAALLIFLLVRFVLLFFRVDNYYRRLNRRYGDNAARADACYRQLLKQLGFLGLEMAPSDTIQSFARRVDDTLSQSPAPDGAEAPQMSAVCRAVEEARFALREPQDAEIRRMCDYFIRQERTLRRNMGLGKYILRRMLLGR